MKHYTFVDYASQAYSAMVALLILFFHNHTVKLWLPLVGAHCIAIAIVHALVRRGSQPGAASVLTFLRHFYPVALYLWFFAETGSLNRMFFTEYLDPTVIRWEQSLFGFQPSVVFMQRLPYLLVSEAFYLAYFSYYVMIVGIGIALYRQDRNRFFHYISVTSFVFYVCYTIYIFLPVIGPPVFFFQSSAYALPADIQQLVTDHSYPEALKSGPMFQMMGWIYRVFDSPGAALPSSHVAIALCTVFFSFRYRLRIRYVHLFGAIMLCLATIYCRYHYAIDVVAGVLTAAVLIPFANWCYFRFTPGNQRETALPECSLSRRQ